MTNLYRYVPFKHVPIYAAAGWIILDSLHGSHHGRHAVLCRACHCHRETRE